MNAFFLCTQLHKSHREDEFVDKLFSHAKGFNYLLPKAIDIVFLDYTASPVVPKTFLDIKSKFSPETHFFMFKKNKWYFFTKKHNYAPIKLKTLIKSPIYKNRLLIAHIPVFDFDFIDKDNLKNSSLVKTSSYTFKVFYNKQNKVVFVHTKTLINILELKKEQCVHIQNRLQDPFVGANKFVELLNMALALCHWPPLIEKIKSVKKSFIVFMNKNIDESFCCKKNQES